MAETVGLVGIGLMGQAMARRLLDAGHRVVGFDVSAERRADLEAMGGEAAGSVAEVAKAAPTVILAVMTMGQVEQVTEGPDGVAAAAAGRATTVLCTTTCEPDRIAALAERVSARGVTLIDAPVSGASKQVLEGDGFGLMGGDPAAIAVVDDVLRVIYPRYEITGPAGSGTLTKLAVNLILGINRMAVAEGLVFAETLGLDKATFLSVARQSAAYSQVMDVKGPKMVTGDFSPISKVSQHLKDVRVMVDEAARRGQDLPLGRVLMDTLVACEANGDGERDNAITIEEIRRRRTN